MSNSIKIENSKFRNRESIGLKIENNLFKFIFPYNYLDADVLEKLSNDDKISLKEEIFALMEIIDKYGVNDISSAGDNNNVLPLNQMLWLVYDFLNRGAYKEPQQIFTKDLSGKINWKRTIKNSRVFIDDNNIYYNTYVVGRTIFATDKLFELIQKFCVTYSIGIVGWYFNIPPVETNTISLQTIGEYITFLNKIYKDTFLDYKKELITNMLSVLKYIANKKSVSELNDERMEIFTNYFHTIYENIIVDKLSNVNKSTLKAFYPSSDWYLLEEGIMTERKASRLRPDAICVANDFNGKKAIIIIDAKYYGYGYIQGSSTPGTADVQKQITYAEYLNNNFEAIKFKTGNLLDGFDISNKNFDIYNVFVLPTSNEETFSTYGYNKADWIVEDEDLETCETVYLMGVNLKHLIKKSSNSLLPEFINKFNELINKYKA